MAKKDKRFVVREILVEGSKKKNRIGSFDTYDQACDFVESLTKSRIIFCSVEDKHYGKSEVVPKREYCARARGGYFQEADL